MEYDTFIEDISLLPQGEEVEILIRDLKEYETRRVKAILSDSEERLPDGNILWLRYSRGLLYPKPWRIKIREYKELLPGG